MRSWPTVVTAPLSVLFCSGERLTEEEVKQIMAWSVTVPLCSVVFRRAADGEGGQ